MSFVKKFNLYTLLALVATSVGLPVNTASAAPGTPADYPLFLANSAEANVFFMVDDSGSMDVEMMTPETIVAWGGAMELGPTATSYDDPGIYHYLFGEGCTQYEVDNPPIVTSCDQDNEVDNPNGYNSWSGTNAENSYNNRFILPTQTFINDTYAGSMTDQLRGAWRGRNSDYNKLYYDPTEDYSPWVGVNDSGAAYPDYRTVGGFSTTVPVDPYYAAGPTYDLVTTDYIPVSLVDGSAAPTGPTDPVMSLYPATYWVWEDTDGDGDVDANILEDLHERVEIRTGLGICAGGTLATKTVQLTGCLLRSYDDEIRNFANWFVYHRKRDYEAKYAISRVIAPEEKVRMGMATINDQAAAEIQLASMDLDYTAGNKATLLNRLFQMNSSGSTPLRRALQRSGNYFACNGTTPFGNGTCALQTEPNNPGETPPGACQQNFTVLISDGERSGGGNDNLYATAAISDDDGDGSTFSGDYYPDGVLTNITDFNFAGEPYADPIDDTLADVAMHYYERDLSTLENRVPITCGVDENPAQHMVTFAVGFGVSGDVDLDGLPTHPNRGYPTNCSTPVTPPADFDWTTTATTADDFTPAEKIDDLVHAAFNGRGKYYSAEDPENLSSSLSSAIQSINNRSASSASAAFNAAVISSNTQIYLTRFHSGSWSGTLQAYSLNADGSLGGLAWDTETIMNDQSGFPYTNRAIATFDPTPGTYAGVPFEWDSLTATQQADLKKNPAGSETAPATFPIAHARLDFIRGDQTCEQDSAAVCPASVGKILRSRVSIMGDMINSTPVFVGPPAGDYPNTAPFGTGAETYSSYKFGQAGSNGAFFSPTDNALNRTPMVYVGGNDGMLHAFIADSSADAGRELWAFIPNAVFSNADDLGLHELTESNYEHQYYVDLTPTVIDVYADIDGDTDDDWHTVLVGGLRGGGAGLFAIDVTDPNYIRDGGMANASARETRLASNVMWEFTAADDPDLGLTFSEPAVVPLGTSSGIEWFVVVGNGYESSNTTGTGGANDGNPFASKLFLIKLEGPGADGVWNIGTDYYKIDSEFPSGTLATTDRNGLSSPALADNDGDGIFDRAYAGDILGKMWAFDLTGAAANNNQGWSFAYASGGNPAPLFTASGGDAGAGTRQAITMRPALGRHPSVATVTSGGDANEPNIMVYFGTGQYLVSTDLTNTDTQSFYAVWDRGEANRTVNRTSPASANNHLQRQTIVETVLGTNTVRYIDPDTNGDTVVDSSDNIDYTTAPMHGWYIDEPTAGERSIFNPLLRGGIVFFNTLIPSRDPCGFGGSGWIMAVNQHDGKSPNDPLFDANGDGLINPGDTVGGIAVIGLKVEGGIPGAGALISAGGGGGGGGGGPPPCEPPKRPHVEVVLDSSGTAYNLNLCLPEGAKVGRYSWRELSFD